MKGKSLEGYDFYEAAGRRLDFVALVDYGGDRPEGVYITALMMGCEYDLSFLFEGTSRWDEYLKVHDFWLEIRDAIQRAEKLAAMQPTFEKFEIVYLCHKDGLRDLLLQLKRRLMSLGVKFAQKRPRPGKKKKAKHISAMGSSWKLVTK